MNPAHTLTIWVETVGGGLTAWEVASVALLFVRWIVSLSEQASASRHRAAGRMKVGDETPS